MSTSTTYFRYGKLFYSLQQQSNSRKTGSKKIIKTMSKFISNFTQNTTQIFIIPLILEPLTGYYFV